MAMFTINELQEVPQEDQMNVGGLHFFNYFFHTALRNTLLLFSGSETFPYAKSP